MRGRRRVRRRPAPQKSTNTVVELCAAVRALRPFRLLLCLSRPTRTRPSGLVPAQLACAIFHQPSLDGHRHIRAYRIHPVVLCAFRRAARRLGQATTTAGRDVCLAVDSSHSFVQVLQTALSSRRNGRRGATACLRPRRGCCWRVLCGLICEQESSSCHTVACVFSASRVTWLQACSSVGLYACIKLAVTLMGNVVRRVSIRTEPLASTASSPVTLATARKARYLLPLVRADRRGTGRGSPHLTASKDGGSIPARRSSPRAPRPLASPSPGPQAVRGRGVPRRRQRH